MIRYLTIFAFSILLSCSQQEPLPEVEEKIVFTYDLTDISSPGRNIYWIIAHDSEGNLLDYKEFTTGDLVELKGPEDLSGDIAVTLFTVRASDEEYASVETFADIPIGSIFHPIPVDFGVDLIRGSRLEDVRFKITDIPEDWYIEVSNSFGSWGSGTYDEFNATYITDIDDFENNTGFLITASSPSKNPLQLLVAPAGDTSVSFNDLLPFAKYVSFDFPTTGPNASVTSKIHDNEYLDLGFRSSYLPWMGVEMRSLPQVNSLALGLLDGSNSHTVEVNVSYTNYGFSYSQVGENPSGFSFPTEPIVTSGGMEAFDLQYQSTQPVLWRSSFYSKRSFNSGNKSMIYYYYARGEKSVLISLPEELQALYPDFNLKDLEHFKTDFHFEGPEYLQYVNLLIGQRPPRYVGNKFSQWVR